MLAYASTKGAFYDDRSCRYEIDRFERIGKTLAGFAAHYSRLGSAEAPDADKDLPTAALSPRRVCAFLGCREPRKWGNVRRTSVAAGMTLLQDGNTEGSLSFRPREPGLGKAGHQDRGNQNQATALRTSSENG